MDYFKSLSSAVLAKAGGPFPNFSLGEKQAKFEGRTIWSLYDGTKRDDGTPCSIFVFDATHQPRSLLPLAQNAARKLRIMRHPDVLKFIDSAESATAVYIATERVKPLSFMLEDAAGGSSSASSQVEWVGWGLSRLANALKFINVDASSVHGNVRIETIFLSAGGEWRLGGFELLTSTQEEAGIFYTMGNLLPDSARIFPPEARQGGTQALKGMPAHMADSYGLALAAFEAYNGTLPPTTSVPPQGKVPANIYAMLKRMLTPNAKLRASTTHFLDSGNAEGGYFQTNRLVQVAAGIDNFMLASEPERAFVMKVMETSPESFPAPFVQYKVLPVLLNALAYTPNPQSVTPTSFQGSKMIPLCLRLSQTMPDTEWRPLMTASITKAFTSADRGMRMALLDNLETYADRLENKVVVDKIWPNLITGLGDSVAAIREATLRAILPLAPKLSDRILNNELLRVLAKTQVDPEPGIRTNTTVLIGRLAPFLSSNTKKTVLVPAFARALKDTFVHARVAGMMALVATGDSFEADDLAKQVLPAIMPGLMDKEKIVRDQAHTACDLFLKRVKEVAATLPETMLPADGGVDAATSAAASMRLNTADNLAASATSAAGALAGWAMSSAMSQFSKQVSPADLQNTSMDRKVGGLSGNVPASTSAFGQETPPLPISSPRPNGFKAHSSTLSPPSAAANFAADPSLNEGDEWEAMDAPAPSAASRPNLPGIVGGLRTSGAAAGGKKLALSGAAARKKKSSLADTILGENERDASTSRSVFAAPASRESFAARMESQEEEVEDAWGDGGADADDGTSSAAAAVAAGMADSAELTAAAFAGTPPVATPDTEPASLRISAPAAVEEDTWTTMDDVPPDNDQDKVAPAADLSNGNGNGSKVLTKEEKRAEMQRQREERKARMAALKAQKG